MPTVEVHPSDGQKLLDILVENGIFASKGEGRRLVQQNGLSLNNKKISDPDYLLTSGDFLDGAALIKKGKKKYYRLVLTSD